MKNDWIDFGLMSIGLKVVMTCVAYAGELNFGMIGFIKFDLYVTFIIILFLMGIISMLTLLFWWKGK